MGGYSSTIIDQAQQNGVDPTLALAVAQAESGGQQYNSSGGVLTSSAGALGVMQLEPGTAAQYGADPTDPTENIDAGTAYLGDLINQYGDTSTALAAYNWGPGNVSNAIAQYGTAPVSFNGQTVPAWFVHAPAETQSYVMGISASSGAVPFGAASSSAPSPGAAAAAPSLLSSLFSPAAPAAPSASNLTPAAILPSSVPSSIEGIPTSDLLLAGGIGVAFFVLLDMANS
jgi:hypothetical protein